MKFCHYKVIPFESDKTVEGVCHRSKLEFLATPGAAVNFEMISDEDYAALVDKWGGVEVKPNDARIKRIAKDAAANAKAAAEAAAEANTAKEGEALV